MQVSYDFLKYECSRESFKSTDKQSLRELSNCGITTIFQLRVMKSEKFISKLLERYWWNSNELVNLEVQSFIAFKVQQIPP